MNKPLVSTITPCFNMKRYLKTFLEWLPKQTFFEKLEVVLDHNEPDAEEIQWVKEFQQQYPNRLKHIIVEKVDPIGTSMNRCIKESSGDFLTIWNIDDLRTDNSIELQANLLTNNSNLDIAYGNYIVVNEFGKTTGKLIEHKDIPRSELTRGMIIGPFFMFRKSLCDKAGFFDEHLKQGPDFDLAIRLAIHGKAEMISEGLGYYLNERMGASTRPGTLQPVERIVIELRYGIYDEIDYSFLPQATQYNFQNILEFGQWNHISKYIPNYKDFIETRKKKWFNAGIKNYSKIISKENNTLYKKTCLLKSHVKHFFAEKGQ
jgi:glycosyltransferase involved in cell wall biosynthesis